MLVTFKLARAGWFLPAYVAGIKLPAPVQ